MPGVQVAFQRALVAVHLGDLRADQVLGADVLRQGVLGHVRPAVWAARFQIAAGVRRAHLGVGREDAVVDLPAFGPEFRRLLAQLVGGLGVEPLQHLDGVLVGDGIRVSIGHFAPQYGTVTVRSRECIRCRSAAEAADACWALARVHSLR